MEPPPKIAVIGAGNIRCGAAILAGIFNASWGPEATLHLVDIHEEALDLFDRLARTFAEESETEFRILADSDMESALEDASHVFVAIGLGERREDFQSLELRDADDYDAARVEWLTPALVAIAKALSLSREDVRVFNLVRPTFLTSPLLGIPVINLDWPEPLEEQERYRNLYQALRWVNGDDYASQELFRSKESPIVLALR